MTPGWLPAAQRAAKRLRHPRGRGPALRAVGGLMPRGRGAYRHDNRSPLVPLGQRGQVLGGVHHDDVGGPKRGGVDHPQQHLAWSAVQPPVTSGVAGTDQVVEHDRHLSAAEEQPGQVNVEMTEIADHHRVGCRHPAGHPGQRQPAAGEPGQQAARSPRARQHVHPGGGVKAERYVALRDVEPARGQALGDRRDPRVHRGVIGAENDDAHDGRTIARVGHSTGRFPLAGSGLRRGAS